MDMYDDDSRYFVPVSWFGKDSAGKLVEAPVGWELVIAGDGGLTRRIKKAGEYVLVTERQRRNRVVSLGVPRDHRQDPGRPRRRTGEAVAREAEGRGR